MKFTILKRTAIGMLTILACSRCVSLDEDLTGQPTPDKFFGSLTDFNSFIAGAYEPLYAIYGTDAPYVATAGAEDVCVSSVVRWRGFEQANVQSVSNPDEVTDILWNNTYSSISACNTLIALVRDNEKLPAEDLAPIAGEARFLRALNYFNMVRWFGQIPILTEDNQANASQEPQSTIDAIYTQIVGDLKQAEELLPRIVAEPGSPTRYAAKALLAKVYLTMAGFPLNRTDLYADARDKAYEVMTDGKTDCGFELERDFFDLWLFENRYSNSEFIFALYTSSDNGTGGYINRAVRPSVEGGWADWTSDQRFLSVFPEGNGSRVRGTFYLTFNDGSSWQDADVAEPYCGKLRDGGPKAGGYAGSSVANLADGFYCLLRYADVLLIYAEAANQAEGTPSTEAYAALNDVRSRAGLDALSGLSKEQFDAAVLDERNWELAFECNRWFDLCRRHIVAEVVNAYYPDVQITDNNYLLPKPNDQLSIMTGVEQNPGYTK
ncbi:MAG: RagB/SusD family nutrient uptake outer membrane protein [Bacteroides cellulosilyticus]|nr:RagB/SusD family nutrient uptake outer membrane protein [Bacteroides cellulosilyticus]